MVSAPRSLVIITGASRGIGKAIALAIADAVAESSRNDGGALCTPTRGDGRSSTTASILSGPILMILISRSGGPLREAARMAEERGCGAVTARCHEMDLSDLDAVPDGFRSVLESSSGGTDARYDSCLLVNNAGSLGPVGLASSISSLDGSNDNMRELRRAVDLNFTSSIWISSAFTNRFLPSSSKACTSSMTQLPLVRVVNISSLCALVPFPTMSIYCATKAGRDRYHGVLAKEQRQNFKALNYAPGLCDTEMSQYLANCSVLDNGLHEYYVSSKEEDKWIRPGDTAKKLVGIITLDEYESGSHVDYWDV